MRPALVLSGSILGLALSAIAAAEAAPGAPTDEPSTSLQTPATLDARRGVPPIVAYTYSAQGADPRTIGVHAYGMGLVSGRDGVLGGGGAVWGSPFDRLTVVVDAQRSLAREFSPSAGAIVRIWSDGQEGLSIGALGRFKVEGFAGGPTHDEIESEVETGALVSYRQAGWYVDVNSIFGRATGDDGETDVEGRLRLGHEMGSLFLVGIDGQVRERVSGPRLLPNGRTWDFVAGAQALLHWSSLYASLTAGPTTMNLETSSLGYGAVASFGAVAF